MSSGKKLGNDQRLIFWLLGTMLVLIVGVSVLAPQQGEDSPTPASDNTGPLGVKAAYLTLQGLGHSTSQWNKSLAEFNASLTDEQAAKTTLVVLEPVFDAVEETEMKTQVRRFLERGGRLLTTGSDGARLLGGKTDSASWLEALCHTTPEGNGPLARAGKVQMSDRAAFKTDDTGLPGGTLQVTQRCGKDAVVVQLAIPNGKGGKGTAVWWTSETPMVNAELKQDPSLKLLLASVGDDRNVVFDEAMHELMQTKWDATKGLPILWVSLQLLALIVLLVLSFSRRRGPVRLPVALPRSSPVEFAVSMGDLYEKGDATGAAIDAARRRVLRALTREVGLSQEAVKAGPEGVGEALLARLGVAERPLAESVTAHLKEAAEAMHAKVSQRSTLTLVRALSEDVEKIRAAVSPVQMELAGTAVERE